MVLMLRHLAFGGIGGLFCDQDYLVTHHELVDTAQS